MLHVYLNGSSGRKLQSERMHYIFLTLSMREGRRSNAFTAVMGFLVPVCDKPMGAECTGQIHSQCAVTSSTQAEVPRV